jgi:hypothetical protein
VSATVGCWPETAALFLPVMGTQMKRQLKTLVLGAVLSGFAFGAVAAEDPPRAADSGAQKMDIQPHVVAVAPNARMAGLIRRDGRILRNFNISDVNRKGPGIYCILPTAGSGINPDNAVVQLTPEYYYSLLNEVKVQWASKGSGCPANRIAVYTLSDRNANGIYSFTNDVSFSIYVP